MTESLFSFHVIDLQTGDLANLKNVSEEDWARKQFFSGIEQFGLDSDGELIAIDSTGHYGYCPISRFCIVGGPVKTQAEA